MLLALILAATSINDFPYAKGAAVQGIQWDAGNVQAYGFICGTNMSCSGSNFGWVTLNAAASDAGGGSGAPTNASYITEVAESGLSAEFAMASLGTGLVKNTTTTGVPSIYAGTSCTNQFPRSLNASGAATCATVSLTADVTGTLPEANGGTGATALTCSSGQCLTSNGSAYSCTSTIAASDLSCSSCVSLTSEVGGVLPIANGGTGTSSTGDDQVLVGDSSSAATWRSLTTCTDTAGNHVNYNASTNAFSCGTSQLHDVGGSSPQVQFNNSGVFGGVANVKSDGTRFNIVAETSHPSAPAGGALDYGFRPTATFPQMPVTIDSYLGQPISLGVIGMFPNFGTTGQWQVAVTRAVSSTSDLFNYNTTADSSTSCSGTQAWSAATFAGRNFWIGCQTTANANTGTSRRGAKVFFWRGNAAGLGGFVWYSRVDITVTTAHARAAFGIFGTANVLGTSADPNTTSDSAYFGCNDGDANLSICSNDNSGNATCSTLGSSYPCQTNGAAYDFWLAAAPNASSIEWFVQRLDSAASTNGSLTSDLPRNSIQLDWQDWMNTGSAASLVTFLWNSSVTLYNY